VNIPGVFRFFRKFASRERSSRELALAAVARGEYDDACERFGVLLSDAALTAAERAFYLNKRGVALAALGRIPEAREDFEAALICIPRFAPSVTNLGNLLMDAGDVDGAVALYRAAIAADDEYPVAHFNLGVALKRAGKVDEGVREMRKAQRLEGRMGRKQSRRP
jgi:tetratricopeptide (TPR) repeat protein